MLDDDAKIAAKLSPAMRALLVVLDRLDEDDMSLPTASSHRALRSRGLAVVGSHTWRSRITDRGRQVARCITPSFNPAVIFRRLSTAQRQVLASIDPAAMMRATPMTIDALRRLGLIERGPGDLYFPTHNGRAVIDVIRSGMTQGIET